MAKAPELKANLFSFKTFRSPDKLNFGKRHLFFIHHPDITKSNLAQCSSDGSKPKRSKVDLVAKLENHKDVETSKDIRNINLDFYKYACMLMQQKKNDSTKKQLNAKLPKPLSQRIMIQVWEELFNQIATRQSNIVRQDCIHLIMAQYYLVNNDELELKDIDSLTIVIPLEFLECFQSRPNNPCSGEMFGVNNLGISDYRRVEQKLCCYVPGEVSHIENVMAREYKEKSTRNLLRTEYSTEFTTETEIENIHDTATTERNELSTEVAKLLQKDKSFNISGSVTVSKDSKVFGSITANVSSGYTSNNSSSMSNTEAKNYAKEVTERALERVVQRTSEKRTFKMIKEFEENNKHGFDNRAGKKHVTGVYRWVDKIYDNQLVNYGKRLMFEISVPSPAKFYKKAMLWKSKSATTATTELTPPKTLAELGINSVADLDADSANLAASAYGTTVAAFESETQYINVEVPNTEVSRKSYSQTQTQPNIIIPTGFVAERIDGIGSLNYKTPTGTAYIAFNFGGYESYNGDWNDKGTKNFDYHFVLNPKLVGSIPFAIRYRNTKSFSGSLKVKCVSDPVMYVEWQEETYEALQAAYQKELDRYNEELNLQEAALEAQNDQAENENYSNPALNRLIEERELKRLCIEMMSEAYCYDFGKNFYDCKTYKCKTKCDDNESEVPNIIKNKELEKFAEFARFFETAFEWEIFSYIFYPYYYDDKCNWPELMQTKSDDPIFQAFLQSGMSKVLVPVRPQFQEAAMFYMETGEIWLDGDLVPETEDDRYLALIDELQNPTSVVEGEWQTRIPSTLTIIQANSTYLEDEKGLPCCEDDFKIFGSDDSQLESLKPE